MSAILLNVHVVVFSVSEETLRVLLLPQGEAWVLPGALVRHDESLDDTASQAVAPHVDRRQAYLEQLYTFGSGERSGPGGRLVSVAYFALVPVGALAQGNPDKRQWFPLQSLPALVFDHADIIAYALRRLRYKLEYSAAGFQLLPEEFSLSELQHTYEIILGEKLDKRNFRRRILEAGIIEPTPRRRSRLFP